MKALFGLNGGMRVRPFRRGGRAFLFASAFLWGQAICNLGHGAWFSTSFAAGAATLSLGTGLYFTNFRVLDWWPARSRPGRTGCASSSVG